MDHASGKAPRAGRPVDVGGCGCFHPAQTGTSARGGSEAALGTPLRHCSPDTGAGPSGSFGAFGRARHARQAAETLWALSGAAQRAPLGRGQALPGRQEGRLNPHEDSRRGSFARRFISSPKLSCLKRKLRACANRWVAYVARSSKKAIEALLPLSSTRSCQPIGAASKQTSLSEPTIRLKGLFPHSRKRIHLLAYGFRRETRVRTLAHARTPLIGPPVMRAVVGVDRTPFWCLGSAAAEITRWRACLLGRAGSTGVPHPTGRSSWRRVPTGRPRRRRRSVARSPTGRGSP